MDGIINFYKPKGMTSHDAVSFFRRLLNMKRVGHSGTLDPNVTGVLPICIGKGTRVAEYLLEADKEYIGELTLGYETDTQDSDGRIVNKSDKPVSSQEIISSFNKFKGQIEQVPPMYSALKVKGKKLYELAREGKSIIRNPRHVNIYKLDILSNLDNKIIKFYIKCSKGTYVRTICNDIGMDLGVYGYMSHLVRVGVGNFSIEDSISMDYLSRLNKDEIKRIIHPIDYALEDFERLDLEDNLFPRVINGVTVPVEVKLGPGVLVKVYCKNHFIGIGVIILKGNTKHIKMKKVFS